MEYVPQVNLLSISRNIDSIMEKRDLDDTQSVVDVTLNSLRRLIILANDENDSIFRSTEHFKEHTRPPPRMQLRMPEE